MDADGEEEVVRPPSRSQMKRDAKAVNPLTEALVCLTPRQFSKLDLDERLTQEIVICRPLSKGARKRQMKRISGMLRNEDWDEIQAALTALRL